MAQAEEQIQSMARVAVTKYGGVAEDIAQETRLWLWKHVVPDYLKRVRETPLIGFCFPLLKKEIAKAAFRSSRVIHIPDYAMRKTLPVFEASIDEVDSNGCTIADTLIAPMNDNDATSEVICAVRAAVESLPKNLKKVAREHLAGKTYEVIGTEFGFTKQRVEQLMRDIYRYLSRNPALRELAA